MDWVHFFPPGAHVRALPGWGRPRLYLSATTPHRRWEDSSFYPASRLLARLYRFALRTRTAAGLGEVRKVRSSGWPLGDFARDALPDAASVLVLVGTPGPIQKITVRVQDSAGRVLGYLKYAEKEAALGRLRQEHGMLRNLDDGIGPRPLKYGPLHDGEALLTTALPGIQLPATLPPAGGLTNLLASLARPGSVPLQSHPWAQRVRERGELEAEPWLEVLAHGEWPVAVQHGDCAPWNLLHRPDGTVGAIDWEYGTTEGFPHLDLAYYVLQVLALIRRESPTRAAERTTDYLARQPRRALGQPEARALTRLAAYDAYLKSREDGQPDDARLQAWRRAVWEA